MRRRRIKGIVAKQTGKSTVIITREGEFVRIPASPSYAPGKEVEVSIPNQRPLTFVLATASLAVVVFFAVALFMMQPASTAPEAYVALDANLSVMFSLDKDAVVIEAKPMNEEGARLLESASVEGVKFLDLLDALLEAAFLHEYLLQGQDNVIILSLAAPEGFGLSEEDLRALITKKIMQLKVDSYLKINSTDLATVEAAKRLAIQLNAFILGEKMQSMMRDEDSRLLLEGAPPLPVRDFLKTIKPAEIFSQDEYVHGDQNRPGKPSEMPPQAKEDPDEDEQEEEEDDNGPPISIPPRGAP